MASKKDLIDAQSFSQRRLLTAFTSGAPGGKELEPAKPMRAVLASVLLAGMVMVGGLFWGLIRPGLPEGWDNNALVIASDTGARYVSSAGVLYPVVNTTSARLLVPAADFTVVTTTSGEIADVPRGSTVGILGAPEDVPGADALTNTAWNACPQANGTSVHLPGDAAALDTTRGMLAEADGITYLVVGQRRHAIDPLDEAAIIRGIGLAGTTPMRVETAWINLFDEGAPLSPLFVPQAGERLGTTDLIVGSVVHPQGSSLQFLVTASGELAPASDFALQMYLLGTGERLGNVVEVTPGEIADLRTSSTPAGGVDWPENPVSVLPAGDSPCALLQHDDLGAATTVLASTEAEAAERGVHVAPGLGALVAAGGEGDQAYRQLFVIDNGGTAYALPDADAETLARLGYAEDDISAVSTAWLHFLEVGPPLTSTLAAEPVEPGGAAYVVTQPAAPSIAPSVATSPDAGGLAVDDDSPGQCEPGVVRYDVTTPAALSLLQADEAWERATGEGVVVAIIDTGIDASNAHLRDAVVGGINLVGDGERADGLSDLNGHGTAIAGIIAAREIPESGVVGLAPDATLLSVRVLRGTDDESVERGFGPSMARVAQGIRWAADNGADIINVSLSDIDSHRALDDAVDYATARGALVVSSAGNRNTTEDTQDAPRYPAAHPHALAVTATDTAGRVTDDSIHGSHVELAAPGMNISTSALQGGDCIYATSNASSSFATAYASASAALVAGAHPDETPTEWKYRLLATAVRVDPDARDDYAGWGFVQPADAIDLEIGAVARGPEHPALALSSPVEARTPEGFSASQAEVPLRTAHGFAIGTGIVGLIALSAMATISRYRARVREAAVAPHEPASSGLLDAKQERRTAIIEQP